MRPGSSYADWNNHSNSGNSHASANSHSSGNGYNGHGYNGHGYHGVNSYIGINLSVWPDSYYYSAPYYPSADDVLVSPPVTVVQQPEIIVQPPVLIDNQAQSAAPVITTVGPESGPADSFTINIPNSKGGYTAVTLKKSGNGYIGPQGEYYTVFPKVSQLEVMYGK
jgi:hypothetical protein